MQAKHIDDKSIEIEQGIARSIKGSAWRVAFSCTLHVPKSVGTPYFQARN
jgi:hypothetical protein